MAKKEDRKKQKKREKEQKKATALAARKRRLALAASRPKIIIDPQGGDAVFVKHIRKAAENVSLEESGGCPVNTAKLIRRFMAENPLEIINEMQAEAALQYDHHQEVIDHVNTIQRDALTYVGQRLFEQLPDVYRRKLLPSFYFYPLFDECGISVHFKFLQREKRVTGWGYFSSQKPTVVINGVHWIVCFSDHAIEMIVERSNFYEEPTYSHYMTCATYLQCCTYFEPVTMADGSPAIRLFMMDEASGLTLMYREYLRKVAGIEDVIKCPRVPAYVLGYSHVDCKGRFAKAISCWYPGYRGTPEDTLVRVADIDSVKKQRLLAMSIDNKTVRVINEGRHEAIRWYHEHGVPQVVFPERRLFEWTPY